jgi:broad specificity phosphatase PhoE
MPTRILLVRHGQSEWNAAGRWQGQQDPPLTDLGRRQALAAADTIGSIEAVFASDLQRAMETATIIASTIGVLPVLVDAGFRERCAGEWEGLTRAEIEAAWPGYLDAAGDTHVGFATSTPRRPPSWESDEAVIERAVAALARVNEHVGNGHALVVTHGGLIYAVEAHLGQPLGATGRLANGAGREVIVDDDGLHLGERFLLVNDDATPVTVPDQI